MRKVRGLTAEPPLLSQYRRGLAGAVEDYNTFKEDCPVGYTELRDQLVKAQEGLCAYCEINIGIRSPPAQVEHYLPKDGAPARHLDYQNLLACCQGGDNPNYARFDGHFCPSTKHDVNRSCGATKGNLDPTRVGQRVLDPRTPAGLVPRLVGVKVDLIKAELELRPDVAGCAAAGVDVEVLDETLRILNLNCTRLRFERALLWEQLSTAFAEDLGSLSAEDVAAQLGVDARTGHRPKYWSTIRCFFGVGAE